jgi:two-component system, OmpR family, response regulator
MAHVLLVEDDELLRDGLSAQLAQMGHSLSAAANGALALKVLDSTRFDAVILDLGLPLVDGMQVLHAIRQTYPALPVLVLTARDGVEDRVAGLNAGADDYLTKPFDQTELHARLAAMLRRSRLPAFSGTREVGALRLDALTPRAWLHEAELELTQREWALLSLLVTHSGGVVSRDAVLARWQSDDAKTEDKSDDKVDDNTDARQDSKAEGKLDTSNALEVYIHRLRKKLDGSELSIRNVRGLGYMLEK